MSRELVPVSSWPATLERIVRGDEGCPRGRNWSGLALALVWWYVKLSRRATTTEPSFYATALLALQHQAIVRHGEPPIGALLWYRLGLDGDVRIRIDETQVVGVSRTPRYPVAGLEGVGMQSLDGALGHPNYVGWSKGLT